MQTSDALGAAASQLGPDAQAAVVELNKQGGLSHGKVTRCLESLFGIKLSRGGSVHTVLRAASRCEPVYEAIRQSVGRSPWVVPDETGWRVGGYPAWLHTLVGPEATAYVIDPTRSGAVAEAILGLDYDGTLIHDGWSPYDQFVNAQHQQCLNHLLRRADEMEAAATRGAVCFPRRVAGLLRGGLDLRDRHVAGRISRHGLAVARGRLESQLSDLIFPPKSNAANERLARHLWNHRDDLFTFLRQPGLDATNWRAELAIRFGVILRKIWGGSRTWAGARSQSVLMSVWRTCWQQGRSALDFLSHYLRGAQVRLALPPVTHRANACARTPLAESSMVGAGGTPAPGESSLAHDGILFRSNTIREIPPAWCPGPSAHSGGKLPVVERFLPNYSSSTESRGVPGQEAPMSGTGRVAAVAVCLGVSLVLTASRSSRAGDEKEDKAQSALQGVYAFRAGSDDGVPDEDTSTDVNVWQFVITGNVLEMKPGFELEKHGLSNGAGFKLKFRLDPKARPRHFDVTGFDATWMKAPINETALGIYKFEKDELTIVIGSGKERPSSLEGGKGLKKMVLVKKSKR